jgi:hypothetical protein
MVPRKEAGSLKMPDNFDFEPVQGNPFAKGLLEIGNIDLHSRPRVVNQDGSISTVRSMSVNFDGQEVLIPTVSDDGRVLSDEDAVSLYEKTGKHLGKFDTPENASTYAKSLHNAQADEYAVDLEPVHGNPFAKADK